MAVLDYLTSKFPRLGYDLRKARMPYTPEVFITRTIKSALMLSTGLLFILFFLLTNFVEPLMLLVYLLIAAPIVMVIMFFYFLQFPTVKISKIDREISKEIVFAGRFLVVELESGVTLYDAMKNMVNSYPYVGWYFKEIIDKINVGTAMEDAVSEALEISPSKGLTKIFWQISNSLRTGSDVSDPLNTVIETLIKEQQIQVSEYGRKLNPFAMFYMLIAIIVPSLGVTMLTIISIFAGFQLNLAVMLSISGLIGFMQFMFIAMVNSIRPPVEL